MIGVPVSDQPLCHSSGVRSTIPGERSTDELPLSAPVQTPGSTPDVSSQPYLGKLTPRGLGYAYAKQSDGCYEYGMPSSIKNAVTVI